MNFNDLNFRRVISSRLVGSSEVPAGTIVNDTQFGFISGITYNPDTGLYYAISGDTNPNNNARFYTLNINPTNAQVTIQSVTNLKNQTSQNLTNAQIQPEGITFLSDSSLYVASEGNSNTNPIIKSFTLSTGVEDKTLTLPNKFVPGGTSGIRDQGGLESITRTPNQLYLYTATKVALIQDGGLPNSDDGSNVRIVRYDLTTQQVDQELLYETESQPTGNSSDLGLVDMVALDNTGTLITMERVALDDGTIVTQLFEVQLQNTTDIKAFDSISKDPTQPQDGQFDVDATAEKYFITQLPLANYEGLTRGPILADGTQSLILASDNNGTQATSFSILGLDIKTISAIEPKVETPTQIQYGSPTNPDPNNLPDVDDPAIYVHPTTPDLSFVITTLKEGGMAVYDLGGNELQLYKPATSIRYNNVDIIYGFSLGGQSVDLAIASERKNDSISIFQINATTRQITEITSNNLLNSAFTIFGKDDGDESAYGLTAYTDPVTQKSYVFVSQNNSGKVAQLELKELGTTVDATVVRTITVPTPPGQDEEDAQVEGMVVDREQGFLYIGQEDYGIWKYSVDPSQTNYQQLVNVVNEYKPNKKDWRLEDDVEGLTIYYGSNGQGYLLASSQGDTTFAVYDRQGSNSYIGSFTIVPSDTIDPVQESDGSDIINVSLGSQFPKGLFVVHDGGDEPQVVFQDPEDGEIQNYSTNLKYIDVEQIFATLPTGLPAINTTGYNPRTPISNSLINGIASGDTTQTSTILWTRSTFLGEVKFEYSTNPNFSSILGTKTANVTDITIPVKVEVNGLTPGTNYYYRVTDAAGASLNGKFQTAANIGMRHGLNFGVSGDWRGELAPYRALSNADDQNLAFFVAHGDTIYADYPSDALIKPDGTKITQATTLNEYRAKHSEVYSARFGINTLGDLRATTSILATIDDHEVIDDFSGGAPISSDPRFGTGSGLINDATLFENGITAFLEYNPIANEFYGTTGDPLTDQETKLYRHRVYGSDAAVMVLDNRSFRDTPLNPQDPNYLANSLTLDRTMLGKAQLDDLKQDLLNAQNQGVLWKFVMIPEPIQNLGVAFSQDRYEGYAKERTEILRFINENKIDNVVFISADIHGTVVNNLTYQTQPGGPQIATNAFDISTGSVAFDPPFAGSAIDLGKQFGLLTQEQVAFYQALPVNNDGDSSINDKDDFIKNLINQQILPLGYDPVGLNENLANIEIDAQLLQGDYVATHTYGWTQFDIDPISSQLKVTTYGIPSYSESQLLSDPAQLSNQTPQIVSQFVVNPIEQPQLWFGNSNQPNFEVGVTPGFNGNREIVFGGNFNNLIDNSSAVSGKSRIHGQGGNDEIYTATQDIVFGDQGQDILDSHLGQGGNRLYGEDGDDQLFAGENDRLFGGLGNDVLDATLGKGKNRLYGGDGDDSFYLGSGDRLLGDAGNDKFYVQKDGNNIMTGGLGQDEFWISTGLIPSSSNQITDFELGSDRLGIGGLGITSINQLQITLQGNDTQVAIGTNNLAILSGFTGTLTNQNFIFS